MRLFLCIMEKIKLLKDERIKDVKGFEGRFMITDFGRLFSINGRCKGIKELFTHIDSLGYHNTNLNMKPKKRHVRIHQLVGEHFVDNPDNKPQLNHIDGDKLNNHYSNLEWCTIDENIKHAVRIGLLDVKGEKHFNSKLHDSDIPLIFEMRNKEMLMKDIAARFGVSRRTIGDVLNRRLWTHVIVDKDLLNIKPGLQKNYKGENHHNSKLTEKQVYEIHSFRKQGLSYKEISRLYNTNYKHVYDVINGISWKHVFQDLSSSDFGL